MPVRIECERQSTTDDDLIPVKMESTHLELLRLEYPELIYYNNQNEENWFCDICLDEEDDEEEDLVICELCLVVVHPSCYRRDLYH